MCLRSIPEAIEQLGVVYLFILIVYLWFMSYVICGWLTWQHTILQGCMLSDGEIWCVCVGVHACVCTCVCVCAYLLSVAWQPEFQRPISLSTSGLGVYKVASVARPTTDYKLVVRQWGKWQSTMHLMPLSHGLTTTIYVYACVGMTRIISLRLIVMFAFWIVFSCVCNNLALCVQNEVCRASSYGQLIEETG